VSSIATMSVSLLWLVLSVAPCFAHKELAYPMPRRVRVPIGTGAPSNNAPCMGVSFESAFLEGRTTEWKAGSTVTIIIAEYAHHAGQPMRLAISSPNMEDFEDCIVLNHIPQHTINNFAGNLTIDFKVPDMTCRNCTLQLMAFQTQNRVNDDCCAFHSQFNRTCEINQYYSCANIDIVGGSRSREEVCRQPNDWAFRDFKCNYYRDESSGTAWEMDGNGVLNLQTSGSISGMMTPDDHCGETDMSGDGETMELETACNARLVAEEQQTFTLAQGGELETGGVVAIILVVLVGAGVAGTYYMTKNKGQAVDTTGRDQF